MPGSSTLSPIEHRVLTAAASALAAAADLPPPAIPLSLSTPSALSAVKRLSCLVRSRSDDPYLLAALTILEIVFSSSDLSAAELAVVAESTIPLGACDLALKLLSQRCSLEDVARILEVVEPPR